MLKLILISLSIFTSLFGVDETQAQMNDIYFEAVLFVGIFGTMGIISYVVSKKHAKKYKTKTAPQREVKKSLRLQRVEKLYELYEEGVLTFEEYQILEEHL